MDSRESRVDQLIGGDTRRSYVQLQGLLQEGIDLDSKRAQDLAHQTPHVLAPRSRTYQLHNCKKRLFFKPLSQAFCYSQLKPTKTAYSQHHICGCLSPKIKKKTRKSALTACIKHCLGGFHQCNKVRKNQKADWKGSSKTICRWHGHVESPMYYTESHFRAK